MQRIRPWASWFPCLDIFKGRVSAAALQRRKWRLRNITQLIMKGELNPKSVSLHTWNFFHSTVLIFINMNSEENQKSKFTNNYNYEDW